jgi:hypothetical protein
MFVIGSIRKVASRSAASYPERLHSKSSGQHQQAKQCKIDDRDVSQFCAQRYAGMEEHSATTNVAKTTSGVPQNIANATVIDEPSPHSAMGRRSRQLYRWTGPPARLGRQRSPTERKLPMFMTRIGLHPFCAKRRGRLSSTRVQWKHAPQCFACCSRMRCASTRAFCADWNDLAYLLKPVQRQFILALSTSILRVRTFVCKNTEISQ